MEIMHDETSVKTGLVIIDNLTTIINPLFAINPSQGTVNLLDYWKQEY